MGAIVRVLLECGNAIRAAELHPKCEGPPELLCCM